MVNTRRMELSGSVPYSGHRYRTRRTKEGPADIGSTSDSEESQGEEDSWSSQGKTKKHRHSQANTSLPARVRELRTKFVHNEFNPLLLNKRVLRSCPKRVTLEKRRSLTVYSSHKMHNDMDYHHNDTDDDCYSPRIRRHLRHSKSHMGRMERRTALSLRPLTAKSYVDRSPMCNSEDSDVVGVRRSTRKRKFQYKNMSWLTDDQMPKKGYPNVEYSEEDSRDAEDHHNNTSTHRTLEGTRINTRHDLNGMTTRREIKKNTKYLHDYETTEINTGRRRSKSGEEIRNTSGRTLRNHNDSYNKENKNTSSTMNSKANGRLRRSKNCKQTEPDDDEDDDEDDNEREEEPLEEDDESNMDKENIKVNEATDIKEKEEDDDNQGGSKDQSSESEYKVNTRKQNSTILDDKYSPIRTRSNNRKILDSSSSSEEEKVYSLRDRPAKQSNCNYSFLHTSEVKVMDKNPLPTREIKEKLSSRLRFNRRRKMSRSSSDTSDSEDRCRNKYSKNAKSTHAKNEQQLLKSGAGGSKLIPIGPESLDTKVRFSSVGGLDSHIQCLKEMILLPMMYPEVFKQFQVQPPRGVLFHGPPGTGKTLIARALANECSFGSRKVSFFMRKGADLLSKWIGESEKQLRLLFEQAAEMKPSIIFFDELDGLAPVRSSRQDQIHASIVSTLLALMDGLDNRGEVIVIGATNRIDAIDTALRRPGRFDRELFFPLPARKEREEILNVHVSQWSTPPNQYLLSYLAENAVGYCGSDLRALCSEAVIQSFRRTYPQVYTADYKLLLDPETVKVEKIDFLRAKSLLVPSSHRVGQGMGRKMLPILKPILDEPFKNIITVLEKTFPHGVNPSLAKVKLSAGVRPAQMLLVGNGPEHGQTTHLAPAILYSMEHIHAHILDLTTLYRESVRSPEEACVQIFHEVRRNVPSVLYIPSIDRLWNFVSDTVKAIFIAQIMHLDPNSPILLLATADAIYNNLPEQIKDIFSRYRKEVFQINAPNMESRKAFFKTVIVDLSLRPPRPPRRRENTPPPLLKAPTPPPPPMSDEQAKKVFEQEERTLRELRIFLREMCKKLANNRLFYMFTKPVDTEEVPDYPKIITQPMDLETMMTKVDFHRYECAKDFLIDIELICKNALEYNPARTSADKQIRHRACSLRDYAFTLIKNEMDSDFEDTCQDIAKKRLERKASVTKYLPPFLQIQNPEAETRNDAEEKINVRASSNGTSTARISPCRKRKIPSWQRGFLGSKKKKRRDRPALNETLDDQNDEKSSDDESKEIIEACRIESVLPSTDDLPIRLAISEESQEMSSNQKTSESTTPLTVNCDTSSNHKMELSSPLQSPNTKRRLSDLLSPSELLEDTLDIDDVDQALHEISVEETFTKEQVNISEEELCKLLDDIVKVTHNQPLQSLLDLHFQLSRIIKRYSRTSNRKMLPNELRNELARYKKEIDELASFNVV